MREIMVYFKPLLECLFIHQTLWKDKTIVTSEDENISATFCSVCNRYFKYPSRREDQPVYKFW